MVTKKKQSLKQREKKTVDSMMGSIAFISPLSATPQIFAIFGKQEAGGVSLASWILYLVIGLVTLAYGYFHKLRPIMISQALWTIIDLIIITGIIMYGSGKSFHASYETLSALNMFGKSLIICSAGFGVVSLYFWYKQKQLA
jgi:uncharacterized protein with PQ loop repeat